MLQGKGSFAIVAGVLLLTVGLTGCLQQQDIESVGCMDGGEETNESMGLATGTDTAPGLNAAPDREADVTTTQQPDVEQLKLGTVLPLTDSDSSEAVSQNLEVVSL